MQTAQSCTCSFSDLSLPVETTKRLLFTFFPCSLYLLTGLRASHLIWYACCFRDIRNGITKLFLYDSHYYVHVLYLIETNPGCHINMPGVLAALLMVKQVVMEFPLETKSLKCGHKLFIWHNVWDCFIDGIEILVSGKYSVFKSYPSFSWKMRIGNSFCKRLYWWRE